MGEQQSSLQEKIREKLSRELELPNLFSETDVHISASQGICVCGISEVEEYTPQRIVFQLQRNKIVFSGEDLQIDCCDNGMAILHGMILDVSFTGGGAFRC